MPSALVLGAGVFGAALADRLACDGWEVTLVDALEPGDPRSESGGETRLLRYSHGADELYTRLAYRSRDLWRDLEVLVESGLVWFARADGGFEADSERTLRAAGIPVERLDPTETARLYPSLRTDDLAFGLLEPHAGILRAGDGVRALVARAREGGLGERRGRAVPEGDGVVVDGERLEADHVVWATGAWLPRAFPELARIRASRQDVVLFDVPEEWMTPSVPGYADFATAFYGHGLIEPHGMKVSCDAEGAPVDPDARPESAAPDYVERSRAYLAQRFPALAGAPLRSAPVCHYSITTDGNFVFDRHPEHEHVWLLGGGSGHGFKHGPAMAELVAAVLRDERQPEPRFTRSGRAESSALRLAGS